MYRMWSSVEGERELKLNIVKHGGVEVVDAPMKPWCYIEGSKYDTWDGQKADRKEFDLQSDMYLYSRRYKTWESDVGYVRNVMRTLDWKVDTDYRKLYYDIECDDSKGFPVAEENKIVCIGVNDECIMGGEEDVLLRFYELTKDYEMLIGYNESMFDRPYLEKRFMINNLVDEWKDITRRITFMDVLSLYRIAGVYDKELRKPQHTLDYVGEVEFGMPKKSKKRVFQMSDMELRDYNLQDVEVVKRLDEKYSLTDQRIQLARLTYNFPDQLSPLRMVDGLLLRKAYLEGVALPNKPLYHEEGGKIRGAVVLEPEVGVHSNVAVFDAKQMYPSIMIALRIPIVSDVVSELRQLRAYYKKRWKETDNEEDYLMQMAYKILSNIFYGAFMNQANRLYNPVLGEKITGKGRQTIMRVVGYVRSLGYKTLYGDTDSVFVECERDKVEDLVKFINKQIAPFEVEFNAYFKKLLFYGEERGVKKRYAGLKEDGELEIVGLESIRTDRCELVRNTQKEIITMILNGAKLKELKEYIDQVRRDLYAGKYDAQLIIYKSVKEEYKVNTPQKRAYEKFKKVGGEVIGRRIGFVWANGDVEPVVDPSSMPSGIDRMRYWREIYRMYERLCTVFRTDTTLDWFGGN